MLVVASTTVANPEEEKKSGDCDSKNIPRLLSTITCIYVIHRNKTPNKKVTMKLVSWDGYVGLLFNLGIGKFQI